MISPLGVPFVWFWLQFRDDLDVRIPISSTLLWVLPSFDGVLKVQPSHFTKTHLFGEFFLYWFHSIFFHESPGCHHVSDSCIENRTYRILWFFALDDTTRDDSWEFLSTDDLHTFDETLSEIDISLVCCHELVTVILVDAWWDIVDSDTTDRESIVLDIIILLLIVYLEEFCLSKISVPVFLIEVYVFDCLVVCEEHIGQDDIRLLVHHIDRSTKRRKIDILRLIVGDELCDLYLCNRLGKRDKEPLSTLVECITWFVLDFFLQWEHSDECITDYWVMVEDEGNHICFFIVRR